MTRAKFYPALKFGALVAFGLVLAGCNTTEQRIAGAGVGAGTGAVVGGPVGAVAGGVVGAVAAPSVVRESRRSNRGKRYYRRR
jgi:osmotically inducible lipoprotein OsmB